MAGVGINNNNKQPDNGVKFHEGWLEHKGHDGKWTQYWCVLKNNVFLFFRKPDLTLTGTLTLDNKSKVEYRGGDAKSGFKFDLYTPKRLSYFRTPKSCERELWKAYIEGITKGRVRDSIDLLPGQIREIQDQLARYFRGKQSNGSPMSPEPAHAQGPSQRESDPGSANSFDSPHGSQSGSFPVYSPQDYLVPVSPPHQQAVKPHAPGLGRAAQSLTAQDESGLIFYAGMTHQGRPSWYFPNCNRQQAEEILSAGANFGNTLMRSRPDSDVDLAISKMNSAQGGAPFSHFIVRGDSNGYKLNVENPHEPMGSLAEVMDFFVETSGSATTRPMTCNDLATLCLVDSNPYSTSIITGSSRLDDPNFLPPPPSPQDLAALDSYGPPPMAPPPIPHAKVPNLPHTPQPHPTPHIQPAATHGNRATHQQSKDVNGRILSDRSKSVPTISDEIIRQAQKFREQQLKKTNETTPRSKASMVKSNSEDQSRIPPLPPNHPTAGKAELHAVTKNRKLSEPVVPRMRELQTRLSSNSLSRADKNITPPASARQRYPTQQEAPEVQVLESQAQPAPVSPTEPSTKRDSRPISESDKALDELAAITARVTKQPLVVKTGPEVAPKPSPGGVVSKLIADLSGVPAQQGNETSTQLKTPTNNTSDAHLKLKAASFHSQPRYKNGESNGTSVLESEDIVYAELRQESVWTDAEELADNTYLNIKTLQSVNLSSEITQEDWSSVEMNYADVACVPSPSLANGEAFDDCTFQMPWEDMVKDDIRCTEHDTNMYFNSIMLNEPTYNNQDVMADTIPLETYEQIKQVYSKESSDSDSPNIKPQKQLKSKPHSYLCRSKSSSCDEFSPSTNPYCNEHSINSFKSKEKNSLHEMQNSSCYLEKTENGTFPVDSGRNSVGRRHSIQTEYECRAAAISKLRTELINKPDDKEENQVHQSINFKTSKSLNKISSSSYPLGLSPSDEIYEGIEWNPYMHKPASSTTKSGNGARRKSVTDKDETTSERLSRPGDLHRAKTISGFSRSLHDAYYAEVTLSSKFQDVSSSDSQYIDVFANYEDIKAAKAARGSFSGISTAKPSPVSRRKSETGRSADSSVTSESFKKKLGNLMVGPAQANGAIGASNSSLAQNEALSTASDLYEDLDHYQNAREILIHPNHH